MIQCKRGDVMSILNSIVITDVKDAFTVLSPKGRRVQIKDRPAFGLSFCLAGKITYSHNGKEFVSTPGNVLFLPMHATYTLYNHEDGRFPLIQFTCANDSFTEEFLSLPVLDPEPYMQDYKQLKNLLASGENRLAAIGILYKMLHQIENEDNRAVRRLSPIIEYMKEHLSDTALSNTLLAKEAGISEIYLRKLFKDSYHTSPRQYLISLRLEHAKELLTESNKTVLSVALMSGFSGIYHFTRAFKEKTGMTPTEYRNTFRIYAI